MQQQVFILVNTALQTLQKIDSETAKIEIGKKQQVKALADAVFMGTCKTNEKSRLVRFLQLMGWFWRDFITMVLEEVSCG